VLILLPQSETKVFGGTNLPITQVHLSYGQLDPARDKVLASLLELCKDKDLARANLKLTEGQLEDIQRNLEIPVAPTMPAYQRYGGTLYKAIDVASFSEREVEVMRSKVLIQSALFGLISATDRIPWYRLSAGSKLPGLSLKEIWNENQPLAWQRLVDFPIIDMRSKAYVELAPIPEQMESYWVDVVQLKDGKTQALNHFNKTAKGRLVGAFVRAQAIPQTISDLADLVNSLEYKIEVEGKVLKLFV
jgi:cytoplasmic iron level regulating protein YaaA (DUF328/UPF0246 family)